MRLRFLELAGARCACTVGLSSGVVLGGDEVVVEVVGHEVAQVTGRQPCFEMARARWYPVCLCKPAG